MRKLIQNRYILRKNMLVIIGIALSLYFSYHLVAGERGYFQLKALEHDIAQVQQDYQSLKAEREDIEQKVVMMRPGSICPDLLEERVRYVLGYTADEEFILLQDRS
jgi:cell division protein FtsB